ncbi:MAG TPA: hypothetical protein DCP31_34210 [Cyanobacteria bacterium UBA8543]|nr:hypothetical protein [Cyanobacteria bacterium UBA8543]
MISSSQPESNAVHHLARFVTKEAIALLLNLKPQEIYRIDCWRHVIHVVGKGVSTFVSYADLPPILGVEPPSLIDFLSWRKRWKKNKNKAPMFWAKFYAKKFQTVPTLLEMYSWGEVVGIIKFALSESVVQWLRSVYIQEKQAMDNF